MPIIQVTVVEDQYPPTPVYPCLQMLKCQVVNVMLLFFHRVPLLPFPCIIVRMKLLSGLLLLGLSGHAVVLVDVAVVC